MRPGRLRSSSAVLPLMENRLKNLLRFGTQQGAAGVELLRRWGFGKDEFKDMGEMLTSNRTRIVMIVYDSE